MSVRWFAYFFVPSCYALDMTFAPRQYACKVSLSGILATAIRWFERHKVSPTLCSIIDNFTFTHIRPKRSFLAFAVTFALSPIRTEPVVDGNHYREVPRVKSIRDRDVDYFHLAWYCRLHDKHSGFNTGAEVIRAEILSRLNHHCEWRWDFFYDTHEGKRKRIGFVITHCEWFTNLLKTRPSDS